MPKLARYYSSTTTKRKKTHFPLIGQVLCTKEKKQKTLLRQQLNKGKKQGNDKILKKTNKMITK
jgi:hypothetical protein